MEGGSDVEVVDVILITITYGGREQGATHEYNNPHGRYANWWYGGWW